MFAGRGRRPITGCHIKKEVDPKLTQVMKYNGTEPGDQPDNDKIKGPFSRMGDVERPVWVQNRIN